MILFYSILSLSSRIPSEHEIVFAENMSVRVTDIGENTKLAREMSLLGNYETARKIFKHRIIKQVL